MTNSAVIVLSSVALLCASCGPDAAGSSEASDSTPEDIGTLQQAFLESSCWTQASANATINVVPGQTSYPVTSPNASYGQPACPNQYVVDVTGVQGRTFSAYATPAALQGAGPDWCTGFWGITKVMGWKPTLCAQPPCNGWSQVDYWSEVGSINPFVGVCSTRLTDGTWPGLHPANHGFTRLRIVTTGGFATTYQQVKATVFAQ